jgi:hypothetical protein
MYIDLCKIERYNALKTKLTLISNVNKNQSHYDLS